MSIAGWEQQIKDKETRERIERISWRITYYFLFFTLVMLNEGIIRNCLTYVPFFSVGLILYVVSLARLRLEFDKLK